MRYPKNEFVLQVVEELTKVSGAPCKKKLQKIVYLLEEKDIGSGFEYKIHMYGPYSADLDYVIYELKSEYNLKITYGKKGHILECINKSEPICDAPEFKRVINFFGKKTPYQLELITTALFAQRYLKKSDDNDIANAVRKIKGSKFSLEKILAAIQLLRETGYIPLTA